jgi:hypothetical protein
LVLVLQGGQRVERAVTEETHHLVQLQQQLVAVVAVGRRL